MGSCIILVMAIVKTEKGFTQSQWHRDLVTRFHSMYAGEIPFPCSEDCDDDCDGEHYFPTEFSPLFKEA